MTGMADGLSDRTYIIYHTHHQTTNASNMTTSRCARVAVVCLFACMNVIQRESRCIDNLCFTAQQKWRTPSTALILLIFLALLLLLSVLGKCFHSLSIFVWHDTELSLCRTLWSCNAVDLKRTSVSRVGFGGNYLGPCWNIELCLLFVLNYNRCLTCLGIVSLVLQIVNPTIMYGLILNTLV